MKKVCQYKKFKIYELTPQEQEIYGFSFAPVHPSMLGYGLKIEPTDCDLECYSLEEAKAHIDWFYSSENCYCDL